MKGGKMAIAIRSEVLVQRMRLLLPIKGNLLKVIITVAAYFAPAPNRTYVLILLIIGTAKKPSQMAASKMHHL